MNRSIRALCVVLALLAALALTPVASALSPIHNVSGEYLASPYYQNLSELQLTGDTRTDILLVALSQYGYHEGDSDADMGGQNTSGSRNFVEYNRLHGKVDNLEGNGVSYGYYWCCAFATWCMRQAGVSKDVCPTEISCRRLVSKLEAMGAYHAKGDGYRPRPGDFIFFRDAGSTVSTHIGLVLYVDGGTVYTIEGNSSTENVAKRSYSLTDSYVMGFGSPAYSENAAVAIDFNPKTAGYRLGDAYYAITATVLNVRAGAGTDYDVLGTLRHGEYVVLLEVRGNWARIRFNGNEGWISLSYVQYVPVAVDLKDLPTSVTVNAEGREDHLIAGDAFTMPTLPKRLSEMPAAYEWTPVGWDLDGDGTADVAAGEVIYPTENVTATAVFEKTLLEYTVQFVRADGSLIAQQVLHYGELPTPPDGDATAPEDGSRFVGWKTEIAAVTGDATYVAVYEKIELPPEQPDDTVTDTGDTATDPSQDDGADQPEPTPDDRPDTPDLPALNLDTPTMIILIAAAAAVVILAVLVVLMRKKRLE